MGLNVRKKQVLSIAAAIAVSSFVSPASATAILAITNGSAASFAAPAGNTTTFNGGPAAGLGVGFSLALTSAAAIFTANHATAAEPAFSDGSDFLGVLGGSTATLQSAVGYGAVSFFLGSIDTYNTIEILSTSGAILGSYSGTPFLAGPSGNQVLAGANRRITIGQGAGPAIGGIRFHFEPEFGRGG